MIVYDVTDNNISRQNCQLHPRTATEVVLVDILNITYPREAQSMTDAPSPTMPPAVIQRVIRSYHQLATI